jgi:serine/threonine-protein kinase RsbW
MRRKVHDMHIQFTLRLPSDARSVPVVRGLCCDALVRVGVHGSCIDDVALAVTEACANVTVHASGTGRAYEVQVEIDETWCHIRVVDTGPGPAHALLRPSGPLAESGRGLALMRALVDEIELMPGDEIGTVVHLRKRLVLNDDAPLRLLAMGNPGDREAGPR